MCISALRGLSLNASCTMSSKAPTSFLNGPFCKILVHLAALSSLTPQQQLLNILLVAVPVRAVCIWMSSFLVWHPFPLKEPPVMMPCSPFRKEDSAGLLAKLENILLSVNRSLKVCADLVKGNTPFRRRVSLSWKLFSTPRSLAANPREEIFKKKMWTQGIPKIAFQKALISKTTVLRLLF